VCQYTLIHICAYIHSHTHTHTHTQMYLWWYLYIYLYIYKSSFCQRAWLFPDMCVDRPLTRTRTRTHAHAHAHTHIFALVLQARTLKPDAVSTLTHSHTHILTHSYIWNHHGHENTEWPRPIGCFIFIGHYPQKSPIISGSFAQNNLLLHSSYCIHRPAVQFVDRQSLVMRLP